MRLLLSGAIWNNESFFVWPYLADIANSIFIVDQSGETASTTVYKLPFQYNTSDGYDLKVMFLTSKENILRMVS